MSDLGSGVISYVGRSKTVSLSSLKQEKRGVFISLVIDKNVLIFLKGSTVY